MNTFIYEIIEHDKNFPAKVFITSIGRSCYHWHYDYEIMLVPKGSVNMSILPEKFTVSAGNIVLVNSKIVHSLQSTNEDNICLFIQLKKDLFKYWQEENQNYRFYLNSVTRPLKLKAPYSRFIRTAALIGLESEGKTVASLYRMQALFYELIADLFEYVPYDIRQYAVDPDKEEEADILLKIIEYVEKNYYEENLSCKLCNYIGMSEKTLYRFLKSHTDMTLKDLLTTIKMEKAKYLLRTTDKPVSVIANECGFCNQNTFYRIYKKETGMTPNEYKRRGDHEQDNKEIKGYLDFNKREAVSLLKSYI